MNARALFEDYYDVMSVNSNDVAMLKIPIGINEEGALEQFEITEKPWQHILVAGHAGTGKSNYLRTVLASLLLNYSAEQLNVWLLDSGIHEFNGFANNAPAQIKRVNTSCEISNYITFMDTLEKEIISRLKYLADTEITSFYSWCCDNGKCPIPRLIVMVDGFDQFIRNISEVNHHYIEKLESIVRRASACGITFIVSTQDALFLAQHISRSFFELFGIRVATRQSPSSYAVLFDMPAAAMEHNLKLGDAIVNTPTIRKVKLLHLNTQVERLILDRVITNP